MTFTTDQYSQIARGYDKAAADPFVSKDKRAEFAKTRRNVREDRGVAISS